LSSAKAVRGRDFALAFGMLKRLGMRGYITEKDFEACEREFPGIVSFYRALSVKPRTFLELVYVYERRCAPLAAVLLRD
jgi:hypothetical protein